MNIFEKKYIIVLESLQDVVNKYSGHINEFDSVTKDVYEAVFKKTYRQFLMLLRISIDAHLSEQSPHAISVQLIRDISYSIFNSPLQKLCFELVEESFACEKEESSLYKKEDILLKRLPIARKVFYTTFVKSKVDIMMRKFYRIRDMFGWCYDPHMQGNIPYYLFSLKLEQPGGKMQMIHNIRFGTPTSEKILCSLEKGPCMLISEFISFLQAIVSREKRHLYINLQARIPKWYARYFGINDESKRVQLVEGLQHKFKDNFFVVSLPKNSQFYYQDGIYKNKKFNDWTVFKKTLIDEVFSPTFYFPENFIRKSKINFWEDCNRMIDEIHDLVFEKSSILDRVARQDFIEIFYTRIQEYFIIKLQVDSYNVSCRDSIDRAGAANALMFAYQCIKNKKNINNVDMEVLTLMPALLVRKRSILKKRFNRMLSAIKKLQDSNNYWNSIDEKYFSSTDILFSGFS